MFNVLRCNMSFEQDAVRTFLDSWAVDNFLAIKELDEVYKSGLYDITRGSNAYTSNAVDKFVEMDLLEKVDKKGKKKIYELTEKGEKLNKVLSDNFPTVRDD